MFNRPTFDIVVIALVVMVCGVTMLATIGTLVGKLMYPDMDVTTAGESINSIINTALGALVGFIGGRAVGKLEANGTK